MCVCVYLRFTVCFAYIQMKLLLLLSLMTRVGLAIANTDRCPANLPSTTTMKVFRGNCYQFVSEEQYWVGARDYCIQVSYYYYYYYY